MDRVFRSTRGLGKVSSLLLGFVATKVIELSPVPVLLVKQPVLTSLAVG